MLTSWMEAISEGLVVLEAATTVALSFYNFRFLHSIGHLKAT